MEETAEGPRELAQAERVRLAETLLRLASLDVGWRHEFERLFTGSKRWAKRLSGGGRVEDLWKRGKLAHRQVVELLSGEPDLLRDLLLADPSPRKTVVVEPDQAPAEHEGQGDEPSESSAVMNEFFIAALKRDPCDAGSESRFEVAAIAFLDEFGHLISPEEPCETSACDPGGAAPNAEMADDSSEDGVADQYEAEVVELRAALKDLQHKHKLMCKQLAATEQRLSAQGKSAETLREEARTGAKKAEELQSKLSKIQAARDDLQRKVRRLEREVTNRQKGYYTQERMREDATEAHRQEKEALSERLRTTSAMAEAFGKQIEGLDSALSDERSRRQELESLLETVGFSELLDSSATLGSAIDALVKFKEGVQAYGERLHAEERARQEALEKASRERQDALEARRVKQQLEQAWATREIDRLREDLEAREDSLFIGGAPDHIIIDGHNLIHRSFRPDDEPSTRGWLVRLTEQMADRLLLKGESSRIELCFDTTYPSNEEARRPNLKVLFNNNVTEGGADAKIAALLREGDPHARYQVVSTDFRHVWRDAIHGEENEGLDVDLVMIEKMRDYLQALDAYLDAESSLV